MKKTSRADVHREFGKAAELAQLIETELGTILLAHAALEKKAHITPNCEYFQKELKTINKNTLGKSLKQIKKRLDFKGNLELIFTRALETRNYLSHHFYRKHGISIDTNKGCCKMVINLIEIQEELQYVYSLSSHISEILTKAIQLLFEIEGSKPLVSSK
jgi:hypothetical protein